MADIAAAVVCACLQPIWNSTYQSVEGGLKCICGLKDDIEALNNKRPSIEQKISNAEKLYLQAILKFLENKNENEGNLKYVTNGLLPMLEGVYYNIVDVMDKWNTANLMLEIESSKKVCSLVPTFNCSCLCLLREIAFKMEALKKSLQTFEEEAIELDEQSNLQLIERLRLATSSHGLPEVYGRGREKEILMSKLNVNGSRTQGGICSVDKTIPILGMGGVGKTALAQLVYSDHTVKSYFVRIWVSVPYKFDLAKILRTIIEQVNPEGARSFDAIQTLLDHVVESIQGKRLLLVLDDVWSVERSEWDKLIEAFGRSDPSSKILVTTQNYDVVQVMGACNDSVIHLELLSADDCWEIVSHLASEADWNINGQLDQHLRDNFLWKCNGLPLLAHTIEFRLRSRNTKKHWFQDFQSDIADDVKILFGSFFINYYGLSPVERRCFSYCSVFPRNYRIETDDVVELWMSQDYFSEGLRERPDEEEGLKCFETLANRCLFQDSTKDYSGGIINSIMHGLMYEFAQFLTKHEEARHFSLLLETSQAEIPAMKEKKKLRTLFVVRSETSSTPLSRPLCCDLLVKLKCLRTLNLGYCNIEQLPEELDKLVHLRYLNLSGNSLRILPNALCYLLNLQTLRLKGCTQLQRLPEEMGNLASKFRHLHIEGCDSLKALPKEIERLTHLWTLDMFIIPSPDDPQSCEALKLEDLNQLEHIQGSIHIRQCRNLENANGLIETQNLVLNRRRNYHVNLKLNFEGRSSSSTRTVDETAIFDALQPHSDVMSLEIRGCIGTSFPNWMDSLTLLKRLVLCGCQNWIYLPPLGRLPSLESLQIESMDRVVNVGLDFLAIASNERVAISFPKLKELKFSYLASWKKWEWTTSSGDENGSTIMPRLASLQVSGCESLEALPGFLRGIRNLTNLNIDGCTNLTQRCQEGVGADWDKIFRIPNIKIDGVPIRPRLVAESQASSSGRRATPTPDSTNRPSTSRNTSNIRRSLVSLQASTSGSRAIPTPGSTLGLSTVMYSSNTFWYKPMMICICSTTEEQESANDYNIRE